eukprot:COSAG03_NODE_99_length_12968_cov_7.661668_5_plen_1442_part_00
MTRESCRRRGYGKALLSLLEEHACSQRKPLFVEYNPDVAESRSFWTKHGYLSPAMVSDSGLERKLNNTLKDGFRRWYGATPIWSQDNRREKLADNRGRNQQHESEERATARFTSAQKRAVQQLARPTKTSRFVGVSWNKATQRWYVYISNGGRNKHIGLFGDEETAARAYDAAAQELGRSAVNFPTAGASDGNDVSTTDSSDGSDSERCSSGHEARRRAASTKRAAQRLARPTETSRFVGVSWHKANQRWQVRISNDGQNKYIGSFGDEEAAAQAYDAAALELGRSAVNFPATGVGSDEECAQWERLQDFLSRASSTPSVLKSSTDFMCLHVPVLQYHGSGNGQEVGDVTTGAGSDESCCVVLEEAASEGTQATADGQPPARPTKTSRFVGVSWHKESQAWQVGIKNGNRKKHIGCFDNEETAAQAYDAAALELGRSAVNFPTAGASDDNDVSTVDSSDGSDSECCSSGYEARCSAASTKRAVQRLARPTETSRFVGVSWHKANQRWRAHIYNGGRTKHIGYFDDEETAARAYDAAALELGCSAVNFPTAGAGDDNDVSTVDSSDGSDSERCSSGQEARRRAASTKRAVQQLAKTSRFVGVSWHKATQRWEVKIGNGGSSKYIGCFDNEETAAQAYDAAALELGRSAVNFPTVGASDDNDVSTTDSSDGSDSECCSSGHEARCSAASTKRAVQRLARPTETSRFVGVSWHKANQRWRAHIYNGGRTKHIGSFDDEETAARAYDAAALELGRSAVNFPTAGASDGNDVSTVDSSDGSDSERCSSGHEARRRAASTKQPPRDLSRNEYQQRAAESGVASDNAEFAKAACHDETARTRALRYSVGDTVSVEFLVGSRVTPTPFSGRVLQVISTYLYQIAFDDGEVLKVRRDQMRRLQQDRPSAAQTAGQHPHPHCSTCCICSESFADMPPATEVSALPCKHSFCASCIEHWFHESDQNSCPVCRRVYSGLRHCFKTAAGLVDTFQPAQQEIKPVAVDCSSGSGDQVESGACDDCGGEGCHDDPLVVCDGCNTTLHLQCVQHKLQAKPAGRWFCCRSDECTIKAKHHEWLSKATRQRQFKAPIAQYSGEVRATKPKGLCPLQWLQRECASRSLSAGGHMRDLCDRLARWELNFPSAGSCNEPGNAKETDRADTRFNSSASHGTLIGMRVRKLFCGYGYYNGRVLSLCGTDRCKIKYDDGDVEELDTSEALKLQVGSKHGHKNTKHTKPPPSSTGLPWTDADDQHLLRLIKSHGAEKWQDLSKAFNACQSIAPRTASSLRERYSAWQNEEARATSHLGCSGCEEWFSTEDLGVTDEYRDCVMKPEKAVQVTKPRKAHTRMDGGDSAIARDVLRQYLAAEAGPNANINYRRISPEKQQTLVKLVNDEYVRLGRQPVYNLKKLHNWSKNAAYKETIRARGAFPESWARKTPVGMSVPSECRQLICLEC